MRKRRWALLAAFMLTAITFAFMRGWYFTWANEQVRNDLLLQLRPVLGDSRTLSQVRTSIIGVHVRGLEFYLPKQGATVSLQDLRIGYDIFRLLNQDERFHPLLKEMKLRDTFSHLPG